MPDSINLLDDDPEPLKSDSSAQERKYDLFLSHASEDVVFCEQFANDLRNAGVRVWFDRWELQAGDNLLARLNDGLKRSRKVVAVWSPAYWRDHKVWTLAESFAQLAPDLLSRDRPLIPVLIEGEASDVLPLFRSILHLDYRRAEDRPLRFQELLRALDLARPEKAEEERLGLREYPMDRAGLGREGQRRGRRFEDDVAALYRLLDWKTTQDTQLSGMQIDMQIEKRDGGLLTQAIVECKDKRVTNAECDQLLAQENVVSRKLPRYRWIAVSSQGFTADARAALEKAGWDCTTYPDLLSELVRLDSVVDAIVRQYQEHIERQWEGDDQRFIRPFVREEFSDEPKPAVDYFARWLGTSDSGLLVLLGDLGTGKTTLLRFVASQMALAFQQDPLRNPAPVLIELKRVRKEVSLESILISYFNEHGVAGLDFSRFAHLLRAGRVVLFFDAFDEMADRVRWEVTRDNFQQLRRAVQQYGGKAVVSCRTHYFKDRQEQSRVIGMGPTLGQTDTALLEELRGQPDVRVLYLQEFREPEILAYLRRVRGASAEADWQVMKDARELDDLARRPLLLELIVRFIDRLKGRHITAANVYTVCTQFWVQREGESHTVLDSEVRVKLMIELAWRFWQQEADAINYRDLLPFVERVAAEQSIDFGDKDNREAVVNELHAASFLRGDGTGRFTFMHRSFMEFFLARRIQAALEEDARQGDPTRGHQPGNTPLTHLQPVLSTRRFDRKVVYFLTLLDEKNHLVAPVQQLLTGEYQPQASENGLQILYWSARIGCGMEDKIQDMKQLRQAVAKRIPASPQLPRAQLQEIVLEGASLTKANLQGSDFTKANLRNIHLSEANLSESIWIEADARELYAEHCNFQGANLEGALFAGARLRHCRLTKAVYEPSLFATAELEAMIDHKLKPALRREDLTAVVQRGDGGFVRAVAWHPKQDLLSMAGEDNLIRVYRASDGRLLRTLEGHGSTVYSLVFDPSGQRLASGSRDQTVKVWEVARGKLLSTLVGHHSSVNSVAFDPSGKRLASGSADKTVKLWSAASGQLLDTLKGHASWVNSVAFDPSGRRLTSGSRDKTVKLWEAASGQLLSTLEGHRSDVYNVAFDPSGQSLASGSADRTVKLWEAASGKLLSTLEGHGSDVYSVAFDPGGQSLASGGGDQTVKLWHARSGHLVRTLEGHTSLVSSVAFDPSGQRLASGSADKAVKLWEAASGKLLATLEGHRACVCSVAFDSSSQRLASSSADRTVKLWEVASGKLLGTLEGHGSSVNSVAFDSSGQRLASGSADNTVKLWEVPSGKLLRTLEGHGSEIRSVVFDPTGQHLASGSGNQTVKLWEAASGKLIGTLQGYGSFVYSVAFDPTGQRLATGSGDNRVKLWEVPSGKLLLTLEGHGHPVSSVAFDPSGQRLACGSADKTVKVWEAASGVLLATLKGHSGPVRTVGFSPNGKYLVAAGAAGRLQFWDVEGAETFLYLYSFSASSWLALLPDGRFDATPDALPYLAYTERGTFNSYTAEELLKEFHDPAAVESVLSRYGVPVQSDTA